MSLKSKPIQAVPEITTGVAQAAFPAGNPYLTLRDELGVIFADEDFVTLFPKRGQSALPPWRLALVTLMQFRENLSDRQAAEAVRARIDWKYLLGLELTDEGFDFSVLSEFRARLLAGGVETLLLDKLLTQCRLQGLLKARGRQRTDATHVLAAIRVLNRFELVGETLRATLNALATVAPDWLQAVAPVAWYERYGKRIENTRLPQEQSERETYAQTVGEDGLALLALIDSAQAPQALRHLPVIETLRQVWQRHYERVSAQAGAPNDTPSPSVRFRPKPLSKAAETLESPYDPEARYRTKRDTQWTGYTVHLTETCEPTQPHLITQVHTTTAAVHEAQCTTPIQQALVDKELPPSMQLVDAAYVGAELLVESQQKHGIELRGPTRPDVNWQTKVEGAYTLDQFEVDWSHQQVRCPQGRTSKSWYERKGTKGQLFIQVRFSQQDCGPCPARPLCTRGQHPRMVHLHPRIAHNALVEARTWYASEAGKQEYKQRAGIEGSLSQGVRAFGLRRTRYKGLAKTHLQHIATAAAMNVDRLFAWFEGHPRAKTRTSRFAALAPV